MPLLLFQILEIPNSSLFRYISFLCQLQTGNLLKGETTCERFAKTNYKRLHALHQENMSIDLSYDQMEKPRLSIMSVDDNTNPRGVLCGNLTGMCCNKHVMSQREIIERVQEAYTAKQLEKSAQREASATNESALSNYRNVAAHK